MPVLYCVVLRCAPLRSALQVGRDSRRFNRSEFHLVDLAPARRPQHTQQPQRLEAHEGLRKARRSAAEEGQQTLAGAVAAWRSLSDAVCAQPLSALTASAGRTGVLLGRRGRGT